MMLSPSPIFSFARCATAFAISTISVAANAATSTASLDVSASIPEVCTVGGPVTVDFGNLLPANNQQIVKDSAIQVNCSSGAPYQVTLPFTQPFALQPASGANGATPLPYSFLLIGGVSGPGGSTISRTGAGATVDIPIQLRITFNGNEKSGFYSQAIPLTVTF